MRRKAQTLSLTVPEGWEKLSPAQLRVICRWAFRGLDRRTAQMKMFLQMNGLALCRRSERSRGWQKEYRVRRGGHRYWLPSSVLRDGAAAFDFVFDSTGTLPFCPLPKVPHTLFGVSFETYYSADAQIFRYQKEGRKACMARAVQLLTGRRRRLGAVRRAEVAVWWHGVQLYLKRKYPHVFDGEGDGGASNPAETLLDILESLNNQSPQENERILRSDTHYVLSSLENRIIQSENISRHAKR